jgi:hypothetical protein
MLSSPKGSSDFDPAEFFAFAQWLYDMKPALCSQVVRRAIVGRAYYAALICARDAAGGSSKGEFGHAAVVRALKAKDIRAGSKLDSLRIKRTNADYEMGRSITDRDVTTALHDSLTVLAYFGKAPEVGEKPYSGHFVDHAKVASSPG